MHRANTSCHCMIGTTKMALIPRDRNGDVSVVSLVHNRRVNRVKCPAPLLKCLVFVVFKQSHSTTSYTAGCGILLYNATTSTINGCQSHRPTGRWETSRVWFDVRVFLSTRSLIVPFRQWCLGFYCYCPLVIFDPIHAILATEVSVGVGDCTWQCKHDAAGSRLKHIHCILASGEMLQLFVTCSCSFQGQFVTTGSLVCRFEGIMLHIP